MCLRIGIPGITEQPEGSTLGLVGLVGWWWAGGGLVVGWWAGWLSWFIVVYRGLSWFIVVYPGQPRCQTWQLGRGPLGLKIEGNRARGPGRLRPTPAPASKPPRDPQVGRPRGGWGSGQASWCLEGWLPWEPHYIWETLPICKFE